MTVRVGINGFGRIGRNFFRAVQRVRRRHRDRRRQRPRATSTTLAHLLKYDSILGRLDADVVGDRRASITVGGTKIKALAERDPAALPWGDLGADIVDRVHRPVHQRRPKAKAHIDAGAKKVIISAPANERGHHDRDGRQPRATTTPATHHVISNASCTTNCLAPDGQGAPRRVRHRQGPDDHDPRLHRTTRTCQDAPAQGPAPRPRRRRSTSSRPPPVPRRRSAWCCRSSRASSTATPCACRCRPARPPTSPSTPAAR